MRLIFGLGPNLDFGCENFKTRAFLTAKLRISQITCLGVFGATSDFILGEQVTGVKRNTFKNRGSSFSDKAVMIR